MQRQGFIFLQKSKIQTVGKRKKNFSYFISEIPNFSNMGFFLKCSMFCRSIPLRFIQLINPLYFKPTVFHLRYFSFTFDISKKFGT